MRRSTERSSRRAEKLTQIHGYRSRVCGFYILGAAGDMGKGVLEAHNKHPLHLLPKNQFVQIIMEGKPKNGKAGQLMDINSLSQAIGLFVTVMAAIRETLAMMPDDHKKVEVQASLEQAERQLKIAEATIAQELRYEICRNHFPPEIMLSPDGANWECPKCHEKRDTTRHLKNPRWFSLK